MPNNVNVLQNEQLWKSVIGEMQISMSPAFYNMFFPKTKIKSVDGDTVVVTCPGEASKKVIEASYTSQIKDLLKSRTGTEYNLVFETDLDVPKHDQTPLFSTNNTGVLEQTHIVQQNKINSGLIEDYTFENFIVGPNNRLAHTVAKSVADNPGRVYNPFLIYSDVGLGKTHLLQAIGNQIARKRPELRVLYCTGQDFLNELMEEMQTYRSKGGTLGKFKAKFTSADVWLIDDVQHIAGRDTTQEEFYFAFNNLYLNKKQIVLSTDKHPSEIAKLENRISSRFNMGMIADMQMPDVDVRNAILRNKRSETGVEIDNDTIDFIAQNINTNIRELEGAFLQVVTYAKAENRPANIEIAKAALSRSIVEPSEKNIRPNKIVQEVSKYFGVEIREIKGKKRTKDLVLPRHIAMYLLKEITQLPLIDIGQALGGRDHTTVLHGCGKIKLELENENYRLKRQISDIKENILTRQAVLKT